MSILQNTQRLIQSTPVRLSTTSATTLVDGKKNGVLIENIRIVNVGSGAPTVTLDLFDSINSVAYVIQQAFPFAAAGSSTGADLLKIDQQFWIPGQWQLRATRTGGSANDLHCFSLYGAAPPPQLS